MPSKIRLLSYTVLACVISACPGRLENPELFVGGGGPGPIVSCTLATSAVETQLVRPRCATSNCHDRGGRAGGLDLESPNLASRLVGVPSGCMGQLLVIPGSGGAGYFVDKLGASPRCGRRMPSGSPAFTPSEVSCVREWLATLGIDAGTMDVPIDMVRPDIVDVSVDHSDIGLDRALDAADADVLDAANLDDADAGDPMDVTDTRTDIVDARTDAVDARTDAVDARADVVDARADVVDARADVVDASDASDDIADASDASDDATDAE